MKAGPPSKRVFWAFVLSLLVPLYVHASTCSRRHATWQSTTVAIRGGGGSDSSPYELNPSYQPPLTTSSKVNFPPPAGDMNNNNPHQFNSQHPYGQQQQQHQQQPTFMPHQFHIETTTHTSLFATEPTTKFNDFRSVLDSIQQYLLRMYRSHPDLFGVSTISVVTFLLWQIPALYSFLQSNFVCSRRNLQSGRVHVLVTNSISHFSFFHLLFNLVTLNTLGPQVKSILQTFSSFNNLERTTTTNRAFFALMLGSALSGSILNALLAKRDGCLGLSGVTLGLFALLARRYPNRIITIRLMGILPISMASNMILRLLLIWSCLGSFVLTKSSIAHLCHLGGILFGIAYYELLLTSHHRQWRLWGSKAFWAGLKR